MAQLNPNFEIDFNDINSYEQIQLINDTQLAKENLLMHRAYKEPSDDIIIQNKFSSFTFVDFCPKLYSVRSPSAAAQTSASTGHRPAASPEPNPYGISLSSSGSKSMKCYELETFSDLFERINSWLKLNKEWRVVSMETLVFDCTTQFNHLRSSIHSIHLPKNTRGLRLYLSPSKSRFSGPQMIGCINVVPRKVSGSHSNFRDDPVKYETLDDILSRLNELLLNRPIEGRILSVETITLPMANGYVNTESNYFMDSRLNIVNQSIYNVASPHYEAATASTGGGAGDDDDQGQDDEQAARGSASSAAEHLMIDILRVYYEFGPMICGLVNLIDFIPRFYLPTPTTAVTSPGGSGTATPDLVRDHNPANGIPASDLIEPKLMEKIAATESLTRLIRRSLAWFEEERKRVMADTSHQRTKLEKVGDEETGDSNADAPANLGKNKKDKSNKAVDLKCCSLQVCNKIMLKCDLIKVNPTNALETVKTRVMAHERAKLDEPIVCAYCSNASTNDPAHTWCQHLVDLCQPYELKFVRLAYVVPVYNKYARTIYPMPRLLRNSTAKRSGVVVAQKLTGVSESSLAEHPSSRLIEGLSSGSSTTSSSSSSSASSSSSDEHSPSVSPAPTKSETNEQETEPNDETPAQADCGAIDLETLRKIEEFEKQSALAIVQSTNARLHESEAAHQLGCDAEELNDKLIGQLTYRLFAPCQLVNSSSCFAINPVNSSSPLARRGSVDLNGSGLSSENAHPSSSSLLNQQHLTSGSNLSLGGGAATTNDSNHLVQQSSHSAQQQVIMSFGAMFPALHHEFINSTSSSSNADSKHNPGSKFTTNEFETVDAIRRRMEVYVTTNSMKVIAGETLIVNLSDVLSCLSSAIERTVVKASFAQRTPSTWASVYILYAAVEEPLLPAHLLSSQRQRELEQISEEASCEPVNEETGEPIFDDDFKGNLKATPKTERKSQLVGVASAASNAASGEPAPLPAAQKPETTPSTAAQRVENTDSIRIEENQNDSSLILYNSAYDRTVALPTPPDNYAAGSSEPIELLGSPNDCLWLDEAELIEVQNRAQKHGNLHNAPAWSRSASADYQTSAAARRQHRKRKAANKGKRHEDSQCSVM